MVAFFRAFHTHCQVGLLLPGLFAPDAYPVGRARPGRLQLILHAILWFGCLGQVATVFSMAGVLGRLRGATFESYAIMHKGFTPDLFRTTKHLSIGQGIIGRGLRPEADTENEHKGTAQYAEEQAAGIFSLLFFLVFDDHSYTIKSGWSMTERRVAGESSCMAVFNRAISPSSFARQTKDKSMPCSRVSMRFSST